MNNKINRPFFNFHFPRTEQTAKHGETGGRREGVTFRKFGRRRCKKLLKPAATLRKWQCASDTERVRYWTLRWGGSAWIFKQGKKNVNESNGKKNPVGGIENLFFSNSGEAQGLNVSGNRTDDQLGRQLVTPVLVEDGVPLWSGGQSQRPL